MVHVCSTVGYGRRLVSHNTVSFEVLSTLILPDSRNLFRPAATREHAHTHAHVHQERTVQNRVPYPNDPGPRTPLVRAAFTAGANQHVARAGLQGWLLIRASRTFNKSVGTVVYSKAGVQQASNRTRLMMT